MNSNQFPLVQGVINKSYFITNIYASTKIKRRLLDIGFVNAYVKILKKSSFRGVFLLELRGGIVALKRKEVSCIMVKLL